MANWQTYTITGIYKDYYLNFSLDGSVTFNDGTKNYVNCVKCYPFDTYQTGDRIEVNLDETINRLSCNDMESTSIVRKASSSAVVSRSTSSEVVVPVNQQMTANQVQAIGNNMINRAEQSGGKYEVEFTAREEYRDNGNVSARQMSWVYRKSK